MVILYTANFSDGENVPDLCTNYYSETLNLNVQGLIVTEKRPLIDKDIICGRYQVFVICSKEFLNGIAVSSSSQVGCGTTTALDMVRKIVKMLSSLPLIIFESENEDLQSLENVYSNFC